MAWFLNRYVCDRCDTTWTDEWSATCDDDCPECGARHMTPDDSEALTRIILPCDGGFAIMVSPDSAEHSPDYQRVAIFPTLALAGTYVDDDYPKDIK